MMTLLEMLQSKICRAPDDESGAAEAVESGGEEPESLVGEAGAEPGAEPEAEAESEDSPKSLVDSDSDEPSSDFETPVDPEAFKEALGDEYEISDEEAFNKFLDTINNATSREELAKSLLGVYNESLEATAKATEAAFEETQTQWQEQVRSDPTYGGENLDKSLANARSVAMEYGGKEFLQLLNLTGAGNNLSMVAFLNKVHAALPQEGAPVAGTPTQAQRSLADRLFSTAEGN